MDERDNTMAFPQSHDNGDGSITYYFGMTLRDFFAAQAMQGACVALCGWSFKDRADWAYFQADAMLKARTE